VRGEPPVEKSEGPDPPLAHCPLPMPLKGREWKRNLLRALFSKEAVERSEN